MRVHNDDSLPPEREAELSDGFGDEEEVGGSCRRRRRSVRGDGFVRSDGELEDSFEDFQREGEVGSHAGESWKVGRGFGGVGEGEGRGRAREEGGEKVRSMKRRRREGGRIMICK